MPFLPADVSDPKQGRALQSTREALCSLGSRVDTPAVTVLISRKLLCHGDFSVGLPAHGQKDEVHKPQGKLLAEEPRAQTSSKLITPL